MEIRNLLECRTLVVSVECGGTVIDSFIASADEINDGFLASEAARCCLNRGISEPKSVFVNLYYCDSCLDRTEYYSCLSKKFM